ncbi:MAG: DUF29 domain-containing protein [Cyanophyceae cyanobacterium]
MSSPTDLLYDKDFFRWTEETAKLLREGRFEEIELEPLIDEVESLGKSDKKQLKKRLRILIAHLLCLHYWIPEYERAQNQRGWLLTVKEQKRSIDDLLKESPSLKPYYSSVLNECYQDARDDFLLKSGREYDLEEIVPQRNPFPELII